MPKSASQHGGAVPKLSCPCGATAKNNSSKRNRFLRRHPAICGSAAPVNQKARFLQKLSDIAEQEAKKAGLPRDEQQIFIAQL